MHASPLGIKQMDTEQTKMVSPAITTSVSPISNPATMKVLSLINQYETYQNQDQAVYGIEKDKPKTVTNQANSCFIRASPGNGLKKPSKIIVDRNSDENKLQDELHGLPGTAFIRDTSASVTALGKQLSTDNVSVISKEKIITHSGQDIGKINYSLQTMAIGEQQEYQQAQSYHIIDNNSRQTSCVTQGDPKLYLGSSRSFDILSQIKHVLEQRKILEQNDPEYLEQLLLQIGTINTSRFTNQMKLEQQQKQRISLKQKQYEYPEQVYCSNESKENHRLVKGGSLRFQITKNSRNRSRAFNTRKNSNDQIKLMKKETVCDKLRMNKTNTQFLPQQNMIQVGVVPSYPITQPSNPNLMSADQLTAKNFNQQNLVVFGNDTLQKSQMQANDTIHKFYIGFPKNRMSQRGLIKRHGSYAMTNSYQTQEGPDDLELQSSLSKAVLDNLQQSTLRRNKRSETIKYSFKDQSQSDMRDSQNIYGTENEKNQNDKFCKNASMRLCGMLKLQSHQQLKQVDSESSYQSNQSNHECDKKFQKGVQQFQQPHINHNKFQISRHSSVHVNHMIKKKMNREFAQQLKGKFKTSRHSRVDSSQDVKKEDAQSFVPFNFLIDDNENQQINIITSPRVSSLRQSSRHLTTRATQKNLNKDLEYTDCDSKQLIIKPMTSSQASRPIHKQLFKPVNSLGATVMPSQCGRYMEHKSSLTNSLPALQNIKKFQTQNQNIQYRNQELINRHAQPNSQNILSEAQQQYQNTCMAKIANQKYSTINTGRTTNTAQSYIKSFNSLKIPHSLIKRELMSRHLGSDQLMMLKKEQENSVSGQFGMPMQMDNINQDKLGAKVSNFNDQNNKNLEQVNMQIYQTNLKQKKSRQQLYMRMKNRNPFENHNKFTKVMLSYKKSQQFKKEESSDSQLQEQNITRVECKDTEPLYVEVISNEQNSPKIIDGINQKGTQMQRKSSEIIENHHFIHDQQFIQCNNDPGDTKKSMVYSTMRQSSDLVADDQIDQIDVSNPKSFRQTFQSGIPQSFTKLAKTDDRQQVIKQPIISPRKSDAIHANNNVTFMDLESVRTSGFACLKKDSSHFPQELGASTAQRSLNTSLMSHDQRPYMQHLNNPNYLQTKSVNFNTFQHKGSNNGEQIVEQSLQTQIISKHRDLKAEEKQKLQEQIAYQSPIQDFQDSLMQKSLTNQNLNQREQDETSLNNFTEEQSQQNYEEPQKKLIRFDYYNDKHKIKIDSKHKTRDQGTVYDKFMIPQVNKDYATSNSSVTNTRQPSKDLQTFYSRKDLLKKHSKRERDGYSEKDDSQTQIFGRMFQNQQQFSRSPQTVDQQTSNDANDISRVQGFDASNTCVEKSLVHAPSTNHGRSPNLTIMGKSTVSVQNGISMCPASDELTKFNGLKINMIPMQTGQILNNMHQDQKIQSQLQLRQNSDQDGTTSLDKLKKKIPMNVVNIQFDEVNDIQGYTMLQNKQKKHSISNSLGYPMNHNLDQYQNEQLSPILSQLTSPTTRKSHEIQLNLCKNEMKKRKKFNFGRNKPSRLKNTFQNEHRQSHMTKLTQTGIGNYQTQGNIQWQTQQQNPNIQSKMSTQNIQAIKSAHIVIPTATTCNPHFNDGIMRV